VNIKISIIKELPFTEMRSIETAMMKLGWVCTIVDNGNFVFEKKFKVV